MKPPLIASTLPQAQAGIREVPLVAWNGEESAERSDWVVVEEPLEIRIDQEPWIVTMRTPGDDRALIIGLLFSEGLIRSRDDVAGLAPCGKLGEPGFHNKWNVTSAPGTRLDAPEGLTRRGTLTNAACGLCGRT
jgi:FdhD protein